MSRRSLFVTGRRGQSDSASADIAVSETPSQLDFNKQVESLLLKEKERRNQVIDSRKRSRMMAELSTESELPSDCTAPLCNTSCDFSASRVSVGVSAAAGSMSQTSSGSSTSSRWPNSSSSGLPNLSSTDSSGYSGLSLPQSSLDSQSVSSSASTVRRYSPPTRLATRTSPAAAYRSAQSRRRSRLRPLPKMSRKCFEDK